MGTRHKWTKEQQNLVISTVYKNWKNRDWNLIIEGLSDEIGCSKGAVKALCTSYGRMSKGIAADSLKGGVGYNWGSGAEIVFNEFIEAQNISAIQLDRVFN